MLDEIRAVYTDRGMIPLMDEAEATAGYENIIVGLAPLGDFSYRLTLVIDQ